MSRIGKQPVILPAGVKATITGREVTVESSKGKLTITHRAEILVRVEEGKVIVERKDDSRLGRAMHGLTRALIANMVEGVTQGFVKNLEVNGVGWTVRLQGMKVVLNVGFADPREVVVPAGVKVDIEGNKIKVSGVDKQKVGQLAADIRRQRKPEPYNAKGIKYADEFIQRKVGKQFVGGGGG